MINGHQGQHVQLQRHPVSRFFIHRRGDKIGIGHPAGGRRPAHSFLFRHLFSGDIAGRHQGGQGYSQFAVPVGQRFKIANPDADLFPGENPPQGDLEDVRAVLLQEISAVALGQGPVVKLEGLLFFLYFAGDAPFAHPGAHSGDYRPVGQGKGIDHLQLFFPVVDVELLHRQLTVKAAEISFYPNPFQGEISRFSLGIKNTRCHCFSSFLALRLACLSRRRSPTLRFPLPVTGCR